VATIAGLSSAQQGYADLIFREFAAAGYGPAVGAAAVVNAYAESGLNPNAVGDGGRSVGLFQLHERGGGAGMTVEQRKDPVLNTRRIIEEANRAAGFRAVAAVSSDIPTLAAAFSTYVERPADKAGAEATRRALAQRFFPAGVSSVPATYTVASGRSTYWWIALGAVAIVSLAILRPFGGGDNGNAT
jgi:hypothetical protein